MPSKYINKYHRLDSLNNRYLFAHSSGGYKFKKKVPAGLVSPEISFSWLIDGHLHILSLPGLCSECIHAHDASSCAQLSSFGKDNHQSELTALF